VAQALAVDAVADAGREMPFRRNVQRGEALRRLKQSLRRNEVVAIANRFIAADRYLIATPMWNSGIPYRLKHYVDLIHQPGLLWGLDPDQGYYGLLKNKHATMALTSGVYAPGVAPPFGIDHQSTYLRDWLNQAGVTAIDELRFQPSLLTADPAGDFDKACKRAVELAQQHGDLSSVVQHA